DHEAHDTLIVAHRIGVRHGADPGEAASHRCHRARSYRLEVFLARLAQVHMNVNESGGHHLAGAVDDLRSIRREDVEPYRLDAPTLQQHVGDGVTSAWRINDSPS